MLEETVALELYQMHKAQLARACSITDRICKNTGEHTGGKGYIVLLDGQSFHYLTLESVMTNWLQDIYHG